MFLPAFVASRTPRTAYFTFISYSGQIVEIVRFLLTCRFAVVLEHFTQDQLVGVFAERIPKHGTRKQIHVAVGALGLVGTGAVKVPLGEIYKRRKDA